MSFLVPIRSSLPLDGGGKYKKGNLGRRNTADWLVRFHQIVHHLFFSPSSLVFLMAADSSPPPPSPQQTGSILAHCVTSRRPDGYTQAQFIQPNDKSDGIRKKSQKKKTRRTFCC